MKKLLFLIILLLFPITVFAKTPNKEETFKIIKGISNVAVSEDVKIESTSIDDDYIIFVIDSNEIKIPYTFIDNKLSFVGGNFIVDGNNKIIGDINNNSYAFYLYSILENKSTIPYDSYNYYNDSNIKKLVNEYFATVYKEPTNTFGITLEKTENNKYNIVYDYYLDGDYPVMDFDKVEDTDVVNPATGNYNVLITIMLIAVLCIAVYTYVDPKKSN